GPAAERRRVVARARDADGRGGVRNRASALHVAHSLARRSYLARASLPAGRVAHARPPQGRMASRGLEIDALIEAAINRPCRCARGSPKGQEAFRAFAERFGAARTERPGLES